MSARHEIGHTAMGIAFAILLGGCAATTRVMIAPAPLPPQHRVLELRIARVAVEPQPMYEALITLNRDITRQTGRKLVLPFGWNPAGPNGQVSVHAKDISLRTLQDEMCRQSGAAYELGAPGMAPPGLYFGEPHRNGRQE